MALFPCTNHGARYRGPATHAYPCIISGNVAERRPLKLCANCAELLVLWADAHLTPVTDDQLTQGDGWITACAQCGLARDESYPIFLTMYMRDEQPRHYFGRVCHTDADRVARELMLR
jgi:hypothetical protein